MKELFNKTIPATEHVIVYTPDYFIQLNLLIKKTSKQ